MHPQSQESAQIRALEIRMKQLEKETSALNRRITGLVMTLSLIAAFIAGQLLRGVFIK